MKRVGLVWVLGLGGVGAVGCGSDGGSGTTTAGTGGETGIVLTEGTNTGPRLDVGMGDGTAAGDEAGGMDGCRKVDFLFVIDNSNSMATNQAELIASFPEFVASIQATLVDVDSYHVGVVSSDAYSDNGDGCTEIGALITQTGGVNSSMATCSPYADGNRFMTDADDLATTFACAAQVGTAGANDEAMMDGAIGAISPALNMAGGCNEGFLRDDALLVVVLITDEDDPGTCVGGGGSCMGSAGDPASWVQTFTDAKGGNPQNVVALSLTRGAPGNVCGGAQGTEKDGTRLMEFVTMLGATGLIGDICESSFGMFFDEAVGLIESACGGFIPPVG